MTPSILRLPFPKDLIVAGLPWFVLRFSLALIIAFVCTTFIFPPPPLKPYSCVVLDRNDNFLQAFPAIDGRWRFRMSADQIPPRLRRLIVEKEDRFFYYHPGVNPVAVIRAIAQNMSHHRRVSGASTITMQVARLLEPRARTYGSKIIEMFRALQLEVYYSKNEILETYVSILPLGGNLEGLAAGAVMYYQTPPERLNIARLIDLIIIPNDPNDLRPDRNGSGLHRRRQLLAEEWLKKGLLSPDDSLTIWNTPGYARRMTLPRVAPHFSSRVHDMQPGTPHVRTTLSLSVQQTAERLLRQHLRHWQVKGVHHGALIVLDNRSRDVLAYVGSPDFHDEERSGQVNAARALRSPGSTLKPLLYALAIDEGNLTPERRLLNTPYDLEGFTAENYDGTYTGLISAAEALRGSLNVPMIRLLHTSGMEEFLALAARAGIASLERQRSKLGLSVILGGCGVTLEEMTAAYAAFPNGGAYAPARFVLDGGGDDGRSQAFSPSAAYMITEILSDVHRPDLPNNFESSLNLPRLAFKTGTSYGRRDAWAIGYSSEYTIGVWIGNADNKGNPDLVGSKAAAPLLVDLFNSLSSRYSKNILSMPRDIDIRPVCTRSGMPAQKNCPGTLDDQYSRDNSSATICTIDREILISDDGRMQYCHSCVGSNVYHAVMFAEYPSELLGYWSRVGRDFDLPPPHNPTCTQLMSGDGPQIVSPSNDMTYFLTSPGQRIVLQANSDAGVRLQAWYVDDRFIERNSAGKKIFVRFSAGRHSVACLDDRGRITTVIIHIRNIL